MSHHVISYPKAIFFGDSLTELGFSRNGRWLANISDKLQRRCDIICRGYTGYNTRAARLILPRLINANEIKGVELFALFFGANDSAKGEQAITLHVPLQEFKDNLHEMIQYLTQTCKFPSNRILLITLPPMDDVKWRRDCEINGYPNDKHFCDCEIYAKATQEIAEKNHVKCVNIYRAMMQHQNVSDLFSDGIHFSEEGSEILTNILWPEVHRLTSHLPNIFPDYQDLDNDSPLTALQPWL